MSYYFWAPSQQNELYHFGVLGMKWGVHKVRSLEPSKRTLKTEGMTEAEIKKRLAKVASNTEKAATLRSKIDTKATRKLQKLNAKYEKRQAKAEEAEDEELKA